MFRRMFQMMLEEVFSQLDGSEKWSGWKWNKSEGEQFFSGDREHCVSSNYSIMASHCHSISICGGAHINNAHENWLFFSCSSRSPHTVWNHSHNRNRINFYHDFSH
mmetsp:Transcript_1449/g.4947  ORF Transcript_1449/g.4947 Transcript_1449/m.4947 type:complete len:106 (+) Transcript_1449:384-701(+)